MLPPLLLHSRVLPALLCLVVAAAAVSLVLAALLILILPAAALGGGAVGWQGVVAKHGAPPHPPVSRRDHLLLRLPAACPLCRLGRLRAGNVPSVSMQLGT